MARNVGDDADGNKPGLVVDGILFQQDLLWRQHIQQKSYAQ